MRDAIAALVPPEPRHALPRRDEGRPKGLNLLGTLAHHPPLARAFHTFNGHLQFASTLTTRERELLVLRVSHLRRSEYEWRQHVIQARDAGLTNDEINRARDGAGAPGWTPLEAAMLRAVDELVADAMVHEPTWAALAAQLDTQQLMDLVFTVGAYEALAMALKSFGVQIDDDLRGK